MRTPQHLYHAAPECTFESINKDGLLRSTVYASESPSHALTFVTFTAFHHLHGMTARRLPDGSEQALPDLALHDLVYVWVIDTGRSGVRWAPSEDHSPLFFGESTTAWISTGPVARASLIDCLVYRREDLLGS